MNINKIGGISGNSHSGDPLKIRKEKQVQSDFVSISETAKIRISLHKALDLVNNTPNIRQNKVESAKNNLLGYYSEGNINSEVTEKIAKKIAEDMRQGLV